MRKPRTRRSDREVFGPQLLILENLGSGAVKDDPARIKDDRTVCQLQRTYGILFYDYGCHALFLDVNQSLLNLIYDDRSKTLIGFIKQQNLDVASKGAGNGQHLLLAARKCDALLFAPLAKSRKQLIQTLDGPADGGGDLRQLQIFLDREAGDDAAISGTRPSPAAAAS